MPRHACLFGKYLRLNGNVSSVRSETLSYRPCATQGVQEEPDHTPYTRKGIRKGAISIIANRYACILTAPNASNAGLYHDEDYNYYSKVAFSLKRTRIKLKPNVFKKDFESELLNTTVPNVRVTTSGR